MKKHILLTVLHTFMGGGDIPATFLFFLSCDVVTVNYLTDEGISNGMEWSNGMV